MNLSLRSYYKRKTFLYIEYFFIFEIFRSSTRLKNSAVSANHKGFWVVNSLDLNYAYEGETKF